MSNSPKTFTSGEALGAFLRVKIAGATRAAWLADAADYGIGTVLGAVSAASKDVTIRLWNHGGSHKCVASGAISAGQKVYAAAGGKVAASGTLLIGTALDTVTANNSILEVLPHINYLQSSSSSSSSRADGFKI
jgi:hypothetical protein